MALSPVKEGLSCLEYQEGMDWDQVPNKLGPPDILPKPEAGTDLSQNARGYNELKGSIINTILVIKATRWKYQVS